MGYTHVDVEVGVINVKIIRRLSEVDVCYTIVTGVALDLAELGSRGGLLDQLSSDVLGVGALGQTLRGVRVDGCSINIVGGDLESERFNVDSTLANAGFALGRVRAGGGNGQSRQGSKEKSAHLEGVLMKDGELALDGRPT